MRDVINWIFRYIFISKQSLIYLLKVLNNMNFGISDG